jgi:hypothetical protein
MNPVSAEPFGQLHAVIDDEGDIIIRANPLDGLRQPGQFMLTDVLHPQLERRNRSAAKRGP